MHMFLMFTMSFYSGQQKICSVWYELWNALNAQVIIEIYSSKKNVGTQKVSRHSLLVYIPGISGA